eukprot:3267258-Prymnesium_polylepis.1
MHALDGRVAVPRRRVRARPAARHAAAAAVHDARAARVALGRRPARAGAARRVRLRARRRPPPPRLLAGPRHVAAGRRQLADRVRVDDDGARHDAAALGAAGAAADDVPDVALGHPHPPRHLPRRRLSVRVGPGCAAGPRAAAAAVAAHARTPRAHHASLRGAGACAWPPTPRVPLARSSSTRSSCACSSRCSPARSRPQPRCKSRVRSSYLPEATRRGLQELSPSAFATRTAGGLTLGPSPARRCVDLNDPFRGSFRITASTEQL